jgi:DNA primase
LSYIPENVIDEIRTRADIVEIVSDYVQIKQNGQNFKGLCPFHPEKTPSFTVSPAKQIYHCFGCGEGGNVFKFIMAQESISFVETVEKLAYRFNISLPKDESSQRFPGERSLTQRIEGLNKKAADYFSQNLVNNSKSNEALQYLISRDISDETIKKYQLGWAAQSWRNLKDYFVKSFKTPHIDLEKAGLIKKKEKAGPDQKDDIHYDRFRARIIFPLKDVRGRILGFAGRIIVKSDQEAKYLNSPETEIYKKGDQVFGLYFAKESIRKEDRVFIFEGYFDQIRAHQAGIKNTVATCGTALTPKQVSLLKNYTKNIVLVFDSDQAGQNAAEKGYKALAEQGLNITLIKLPEGDDPDSFIQKQGSDAFLDLADKAKPFWEYFIRKTVSSAGTIFPGKKREIVEKLAPFLSSLNNHIERSEAVKLVSEVLVIDDKTLLGELKKTVESRKPFLGKTETSRKEGVKFPEEYYLVHLIGNNSVLAQKILDRVELEEINDPKYQGIIQAFQRQSKAGLSLETAQIIELLDDEEERKTLTLIGVSQLTFENPEESALDCLRKIKSRHLEKKIKELRRQRNEAEKQGQTERFRQLQQLVKEMKSSLNQVAVSF